MQLGTRWIALILSLPLVLAACEGPPHTPTLDEVSATADSAVTLVDRSSVLDGAVEGEVGDEPDLTSPHSGFRMDVNADGLEASMGASGARSTAGTAETYLNVTTGLLALATADAITVAVLAPPAAAIHIVLAGQIEQINDHLWSATNTIYGPSGSSITGEFNVAWVGVGWLAEMRLSSSDGLYDDTLWFNGFLSIEGAIGWWDIYEDGTDVVGVVEWVADGAGHGEFGIAALGGEAAGDVLYYLLWEDHGYVAYYDDSAAFEHHVEVTPDYSGEVLLLDYNGSEPACWDALLADGECP